MNFTEILKDNILVLDGALGTMIQNYNFKEEDFRGREFINHPTSLFGFNDILNLTKPSAIKKIHEEYLRAGANIITTNTFNSNSISMKDYGFSDKDSLVIRLNREGAILAKKSINEFEKSHGFYFVGGSIGPTNRSASMSPDISDPLKRNVTYNELKDAYMIQAQGLIEGGIDLFICETFFDTLNLKAAVDAINLVLTKKGIRIPILVSATISDNAGRILSGQTIEAFITSISHYENVEVIGLNCGFGPERMKEYLKTVRKINTHFTSCHPNAGLPDEKGCYNVNPEIFVKSINSLLEQGLLNIVGGCCGTTPSHIKLLSEITRKYKPKTPQTDDKILRLSGLEMLTVSDFIRIGERCNVAGSAKFLRLVKEGSFEEAAEVAKAQIEKGARVIDINMDDPLLDAKEEMVKFIRYILAEPDIAKVPFMVDSSKWEVIESALQNIQGKGIVNSLSLKEGEEIFVKRAKRVKELGFALVVMAFDEKGQADTYERKIEVCERAYNLLTERCGFFPDDIIFDVNVMTIGTGMKEHNRYAIDFIKAVEWIKSNLPGVRTSGGVSNLSFAFRGKNKIREYMHVIFLHHAMKAGLDMAIINPSQNISYENIPLNIRNTIEDLIFDRNSDALESLITLANEESTLKDKKLQTTLSDSVIAEVSTEELLKQDLIKGDLTSLDVHISKALSEINDPVKIIEGPLLAGMKVVGDLFGEGKMFLPQVVKTARAMKKAVEILTPVMENKHRVDGGKKAGKIMIATVKGDVHDIGKNIVSTVLACNNYDIVDLGIMVPPEKIVEEALREHPDIICLSGLITPSLAEMSETVKQLSEAGLSIPVMVGGAATSSIHTALKIAPFYTGCVLHMTDASQNPIAANQLLNFDTRLSYIKAIEEAQEKLREKSSDKIAMIPFDEIMRNLKGRIEKHHNILSPKTELGKSMIIEIPLQEVIPLINWKMFFVAWKLQGKYIENIPFNTSPLDQNKWLQSLEDGEKGKALEAIQLYNRAKDILKELRDSFEFDGRGAIRFEKVRSDSNNIYINEISFPMLRQQRAGSQFLSVADYIDEKDDYIGLFSVTAGRNLTKLASKFAEKGDDYSSLICSTLADRIAEASSEWLHRYVNKNYWNVTIRPAWGYPMLPDQTLILQTKDMIPYEELGMSLTENGAMNPAASVSGIYLSNAKAKYFMIGEIGNDQLKDYSERRGLSFERAKAILRQ